MSETVIEVKDLVAGYLPGVNILNGTNFHADKGELIGIIGPNGAGKSTLLKAIFGLVKVREGSITLNGESIVGMKSNQLVTKGRWLHPPEQQCLPLVDHRGKPSDGCIPGASKILGATGLRDLHL